MSTAVAVLVRIIMVVLVVIGLVACQSGNPPDTTSKASLAVDGSWEFDGYTYRPLTEDSLLWERVKAPDPRAGTPGERQLIYTSTSDAFSSPETMSDPCPCCPPMYGVRGPCCQICLSQEKLWYYDDTTSTDVGDTMTAVTTQSMSYESTGLVMVEIMCYIYDVPRSDSGSVVEFDIAAALGDGPLEGGGSGSVSIQVLPETGARGYSQRVLVRRELTVEPGPATIAVTARSGAPDGHARVMCRSIRTMTYEDFR